MQSKTHKPWILSLDRTIAVADWQLGRKVFKILTPGIVYQGVAVTVVDAS